MTQLIQWRKCHFYVKSWAKKVTYIYLSQCLLGKITIFCEIGWFVFTSILYFPFSQSNISIFTENIFFYQSFIHCIILVLYRYTNIHTPHPAVSFGRKTIILILLLLLLYQYLLCTSRKFKLFVQGCIIKLKVYN